MAGTRAQVIVKLFGDDTDVLRRKAGEMAAILGEIPGAADLVVERVAGQPYLTVTVDRDKVARYGVNTGDVLAVIELAIGGKPLSRLYQQNRAFDIALRFPDERRQSVEALGGLLVDVPGGYRVPLNQLADLKTVRGADADQPRGRAAADRDRDERRRTRHRELRQGGAGPHRAERRSAARLLPELGRTVREPAAGHDSA